MTDLCDSPTSSDLRTGRGGSNPVSAYHSAIGLEQIELDGGGRAGFARRGRWAVFPCEPTNGDASPFDATRQLLAVVRSRRLRPVFAAVSDPTALCAMGLSKMLSAHDAVVQLESFNLIGSARSSLRHSVASASRGGLTVRPWDHELQTQIMSISASWLSTKRGGEFGFALGKVSDWNESVGEGRVAVDSSGVAVAVATWREYADGRGRVLDVMRRRPDAPNPAMDLLIVDCLREFARIGVDEASLSAVPVQHSRFAERCYPTESLRRYKDKFAPQWKPLWLVAPSLPSVPFALRAVLNAFCDGGLRRAIALNDHDR